ncbi:MAG TPA: twin-arginine translocase subunit TatC [Gammaproteobacteria bacterium]|nr:twin-arginine translocase subunit TatC [Gammaproteobacteria bacterium]
MAEQNTHDHDVDEQELTLMDHLVELRDRLLRMVLAVLIVFIALFAFSEDIFTLAAEPLLNLMPEGTSMIATGVTSPFLVPFKLVLMLSLLLTIPYLLHQIWGFIAPGLYSHEKRMVTPLLISSVVLFYCGIAFAYFVIFPILFGFFIGIAPEGVAVMTDIGQYLDFILAIFLAFGIAFEVPVATFLLVAAGVTTPDKLAEKRPYIIIGAFVIGMLLTPPDVISQSLLAVPIWLLFELGLIMSRIFLKDKIKQQEEENVIMENDDFQLIEEPVAAARSDFPDDDHDAQGNPINPDNADNEPQDGDNGELTDEEMERLLDEAEHEEEENSRDDEMDDDEPDQTEKDRKDH